MSETKLVIEERVYVGNVDFTATEEELRDLFEGLKVLSVEIPSKTITRGKKTLVKRLGFGFVQFETKEDADKAIEKYNNTEFKSRHIYAKKALPPATEEEKQKKSEAYFAKQKELKAKKTKAVEKPVEPASELAEPAEKKIQDAAKTPEGTKSKDTVFITNLDYKANVKLLNHLFRELKPKWIHVPPRRVSYHVLKKFQAKQRPVFNKGIAFVKFADEETQLKAIAEFNGHEINGREIIVEAAVDREVDEAEVAKKAAKTAKAEKSTSEDEVAPVAAGEGAESAEVVESANGEPAWALAFWKSRK